MKRIFTLLALIFSAGAASRAEAKVHVVTTVQTFRALAQDIGGDDVEVTALVGDAVDPHFVDARPSYAVILNQADLLIHVGLELEKGWLPPLMEQARNPAVQTGEKGNLDASRTGIVIKDIGQSLSRTQGDIHPMGNPHYWLPPDNALFVARAIRDRLKSIDPQHAADYDKNFEAFRAKLADKRKEWEAKAKPLAGIKVVTYHKSWGYFTNWLGMEEIGYVEPKPGIPPDPSHLRELVKDARGAGAKLVLVESFYPRNTAQRVAELGGMKLVVLDSDATSKDTYFQLIDRAIDRLLAAL